jgi:hypothetical protein
LCIPRISDVRTAGNGTKAYTLGQCDRDIATTCCDKATFWFVNLTEATQ